MAAVKRLMDSVLEMVDAEDYIKKEAGNEISEKRVAESEIVQPAKRVKREDSEASDRSKDSKKTSKVKRSSTESSSESDSDSDSSSSNSSSSSSDSEESSDEVIDIVFHVNVVVVMLKVP